MSLRRTCSAGFCLLFLESCSGVGGISGTDATAASAAYSTSNIFGPLQHMTAAQQQEIYATAGALTFEQIYQSSRASLNNGPMTVDGVSYSGRLANLVANHAAFVALDQRFGNVAALWKVLGIDTANLSVDQLQAAVQASFAKSATGALQLTDDIGSRRYCSSLEKGLGISAAAVVTAVNNALSKTQGTAQAVTTVPIEGSHWNDQPLVAVTVGDNALILSQQFVQSNSFARQFGGNDFDNPDKQTYAYYAREEAADGGYLNNCVQFDRFSGKYVPKYAATSDESN